MVTTVVFTGHVVECMSHMQTRVFLFFIGFCHVSWDRGIVEVKARVMHVTILMNKVWWS